MTKKIFNLLIFVMFTFFLLSQNLLGQESASEKFYYSHSKDCWIKRYRNQAIEYADDTVFYKVELIAKAIKNNPKLKAFKYNGEMHIVPSECLDPIVDLSAKEEINEENNEEIKELKENTIPSKPVSMIHTDDYFFELTGGSVSIKAASSIYTKYDTDLADFVGKKIKINADGSISKYNAGTITVNGYTVPAASNYVTKPLINLGIGIKRDDHYLMFRLKKFTATKEEIASVAVTDTADPTRSQITLTNTFKDTMTNYLLGSKFLFNRNGKWRPALSAMAGLSKLDSEFDYVDYTLSSSGFAALVELGLEYFYSSHIAFSALGGYEYLAHSQLTGTNPSTGATEGFETGISYTNSYLGIGMILYW